MFSPAEDRVKILIFKHKQVYCLFPFVFMNLESLCQKTAALVREAGEFIRQEASTFDASKIEYKGFNNLVSYVDKEAEMRLVEGLSKIFPEAGFVTEEGTATHRAEEYNWVIDPLDGTTNFMHGLPVFAVSVGLVRGDKAVMGVVEDVSRQDCFYAWQGGGAWCNKERIHASPISSLRESLLATGFPYYKFDKAPQYLEILNQLMQNTHGIRRMGAAAIDIVYVACGRFDGFFEFNLQPWDVAGGVIIVEEAGGKCTDFGGEEGYIFGRSLVTGGNPTLQQRLLEVVMKHWH
jgi:myo-inositol-1(or 4)-monophosphatase